MIDLLSISTPTAIFDHPARLLSPPADPIVSLYQYGQWRKISYASQPVGARLSACGSARMATAVRKKSMTPEKRLVTRT